MFEKIVVAYDGSSQSKLALEKAISFASLISTLKIEVIHVIKYPVYILGEAYITASPTIRETLLEDADRLVEGVNRRLRSLNLNYGVHVTEGEPAECIVEFAREHNCDLILIGSRGFTGLKEWVLGSVSHNVVQHAAVPVLVMK